MACTVNEGRESEKENDAGMKTKEHLLQNLILIPYPLTKFFFSLSFSLFLNFRLRNKNEKDEENNALGEN